MLWSLSLAGAGSSRNVDQNATGRAAVGAGRDHPGQLLADPFSVDGTGVLLLALRAPPLNFLKERHVL